VLLGIVPESRATLPESDKGRVADHPTRNGPMVRAINKYASPRDWILAGVTAVFRQ